MAIEENDMTAGNQGDDVTESEQQSIRNFRSNIRRNVTPPDVTDADNPHVVVAGKVKKIGKTSAYMLDMLSLDD